ncbi:DUF4314 domain-containing protein [Methanobrevibacter sp.]|uniref:DUF4314 domain-containing protein n=1 Tax=Methanobrevibacter sp. TaxID=66852 RepID=UPI003864FEA8
MNKVDFLKKMYPVGCKVVLHHMDDPQAPPSGTIGEVMFVDSMGTIHVAWENGSSLGLIYGVDSFSKV